LIEVKCVAQEAILLSTAHGDGGHDLAAGAGKRVVVFGGSGFLGRHAVRALAREGWRVRAAVRRPDLAGHLQPMGRWARSSPCRRNLRYPDSVRRAVEARRRW